MSIEDNKMQQEMDRYIEESKMVELRFLTHRNLESIITKYVKGNKALDYGCGPAISTLHLKSLGLEADGVDICETAIKYAKIQDPEGHYDIIRSGEIAVDNCYYDLVFASFVFHHIEEKQIVLDVFKEFARVLKVGGTLVIIEFNKESYENANFITFHSMFDENKNLESGSKVKVQDKDCDEICTHILYTDEDFVDGLSNVGLTLIETLKPLGMDSDNYPWLDEKVIAPCNIYIAQKL